MPRVTTPPHPPGSRHWGPAETSSIEPRNSHYSPIVSLLYGIPFPDSVEYRAVLLGANEGLRLRTKVPTAAGFLPPFRRRAPASAAIANAFIMVSRCPHCPLRLGPPRILDPAHPAPEKYLLAAAKWAAHNAFSTPRIQSRIDLLGSSLFHFLFGKVPCTIFGLHFLESSTSLGDRWPFRSGVFIRGPVRAMAAA